MPLVSERSYDAERTVVVLNFPSIVEKDELTIHFQKDKNGGGDVDNVVLDESVAFVTFEMPQVATSVLNHSEQVINGCKIDVQSYESWLANEKKQEGSSATNNQEDSQPEDAGSAAKTIYVSDIKKSTTKDSITLFFETNKHSGGGDLREGKEGYERLSPTYARLTFVSSEDAQNVLKKANESPLKLDGSVLRVSAVFEPIHHKSILLARNLNPKTSKERFQKFVEATKRVDVLNVVLGKDGKAIVILKNEIDEEYSTMETSGDNLKLDDFIVSLEFAPLTKSIRVSNIPPGTTPDDIKFKFSNAKNGGGKVVDMMLDDNNGLANVHFEKSSVVAELVKNEHVFQGVPLTVIPYYDEFDELQEIITETAEFSDYCHLEPFVMDCIKNHYEIKTQFEFKSVKYDKANSTLCFTKDLEDLKFAQEFKNKLNEFLQSFVKEEVKIPKAVFGKVKEAIERKKTELEAEKVDFSFHGYRVTFIGKKENVILQKRSAEATIDKISEEAKFERTELKIPVDKNTLKFFNFINYFEKLNATSEFRAVRILGKLSDKLRLQGTPEETKDFQLKILQDMTKITEIEVELSNHQINFLKRTKCKNVNDEFKKDDAMLSIKGFQAKIMTLKKCDNTEEKRLLDIIHTKASEKCVRVDEETASFLTKSKNLQEFKKEIYDEHQVFIDLEITDPCNIWIVCEKFKMDNAEQELTDFTTKKKIASSKFRPTDRMKVRFLKNHCWEKIKKKEKCCKAEGIVVQEMDSDSLKIKGTEAGKKDMIQFLEKLAGNVHVKNLSLTEPGMKKELSMDATNAIISDIEKNFKCIIRWETQPEESHGKKPTEEATVVADRKVTAEATSASTMNFPCQSMSFVKDKDVMMASGQRITIVVGDLAYQKVDVIVNTTNGNLDLMSNACGKALLNVAGNKLLNECKKIGSLQTGQLAETEPGNLKCKRVYHVCSSSWDNGKGAPILRALIRKCLDQIEKSNLKSIAIPAIGTGNLNFPRPEVAKIFFEEVTDHFTAYPQSAINEVRFVAYSGDPATVDAFLGALQQIESQTIPVPMPRKRANSGSPSNITISDQSDGSLELSLGGGNLAVQIVCDDISKETTDLIMHVTNQDFSFQGGVGKALIKAGGDSIFQECKVLGQPACFSTQYTKAGNLFVDQIAHVIGPNQPTFPELKRCLNTFFNDILRKNIANVSFSAVGTGAMSFSESQSAELIFDNLSRIAESKYSTLSLARVVIFEKAKFIKFKNATKAYFALESATSSSPQAAKSSYSRKKRFSLCCLKNSAKRKAGNDGTSVKIYFDDRRKVKKACAELNRIMSQNIQEKIITDDVITKFTDPDLEILRKLERDFDGTIKADRRKGNVKIKGHNSVISSIQDEIYKIIKKIKENEIKVPDNWDITLIEGVHTISLPASSKEYKNVATAFHATAPAPNQIISIERIQNREIYEHYNLKRQAMMKKHGSNFSGKELMLFHGTSSKNIEKINAGGLNRSYAGQHATAYGRGVYFAQDAIYSCQQTYSPADQSGLRYMYYAKVLVGEYTLGDSSMIVAPSKNSGNPNETYDSVVDNPVSPSIYVLFQDYEYYTEYLITFI